MTLTETARAAQIAASRTETRAPKACMLAAAHTAEAIRIEMASCPASRRDRGLIARRRACVDIVRHDRKTYAEWGYTNISTRLP